MDLEKAFDSISHDAIFGALETQGASPIVVNYIKFIYKFDRTFLCFKNNISNPVRPTRGVRQGDPLSPFLFNLVFDSVLRSIPERYEVQVDGAKLCHLAYADDLILLSSSVKNLQKMVDEMFGHLGACGLSVNIGKTAIYSWLKDGKRKRRIYNSMHSIKIQNQPAKIMPVNECFVYLGVNFSPNGRMPLSIADLGDRLDILQSVLLKPQQRLFLLNHFLLPSGYHRYTFSKLYAGTLSKLNVLIRKFVHTILHLPSDIPKAVFHASVSDGGLGVPSRRGSFHYKPKLEGFLSQGVFSVLRV